MILAPFAMAHAQDNTGGKILSGEGIKQTELYKKFLSKTAFSLALLIVAIRLPIVNI